MRSPAPAASQTSPIIGISSTSPRAATTPPTTTAVSPGTSRPDECPGLEEGEGGHGRVRPPAQRARGVLERAVEVGERHHSDDDEHARRRHQRPRSADHGGMRLSAV